MQASVNAVDRFGNTPINDAVKHKCDKALALLHELVPAPPIKMKLKGCDGAVQMCNAAFEADIEQVKRLLNNGVNVDDADYDARRALHIAACQGHLDLISHLLERKSDVNRLDRFGGTPLDDAVRHGQREAQKMLRKAGGRLATGSDATHMCEAGSKGDLKTIRILIENGTDPMIGTHVLL